MDDAARKIPVVFYRTKAGADVVLDWLRDLSAEDRANIGRDLMRLQFRWPVGMPLARPMGGDKMRPVKRPYLARVLLFRRSAVDRAARLHQENAENARERLDVGTQTNVRVHMKDEMNMAQRRTTEGFTSLDEVLGDDGLREAFQAVAIKEVLAWQIKLAMEVEHLSQTMLAKKMGTSRSQISRLLDPTDGNVTLSTLQRAAEMLGRKVRLELV